MKKVSIIIPAHNEELNIPVLFKELTKLRKEKRVKYEVILVDDGSTDQTLNVASELAKKYRFIKVISNSIRMGITHALKRGIEASEGDIFVFFPADLQFSVEDIPPLVQPIIKRKADIVTGRKIGKYKKKFVSGVYNTLCRWLFKIPVHDLNSIKAFTKEIVFEIPFRKDWHRYMVVLAYRRGFKVKEIDVKLFPRKYGKSKFNIFRIPVGVLDLIAVKFLLTFGEKPMLYFGTLFWFFLTLGIIMGIILLYLRIFHNFGYRPLLYFNFFLLGLGFLFFTLGMLGEMLVSIKDEVESIKSNIRRNEWERKRKK